MNNEKSIIITQDEVVDIMKKVQKFNSIRTVDLIMDKKPSIISEFNFDEEEFNCVKEELLESDKDCRKWWKNICEKYQIEEERGFKVDYETSTLTVI